MPIAVFAFLFGLSMDYEVFLLSRIREEHDDGHGTDEATVHGVARTGRLVTSAALILFLAFISLSRVPDTDVKILATALALGIIIDATIVRGILAPALVAALGDANWWWPRRRRAAAGRGPGSATFGSAAGVRCIGSPKSASRCLPQSLYAVVKTAIAAWAVEVAAVRAGVCRRRSASAMAAVSDGHLDQVAFLQFGRGGDQFAPGAGELAVPREFEAGRGSGRRRPRRWGPGPRRLRSGA